MMGKTHMIAGIGAAVLISPPDTIGGCLQALLGGALGGLICDLDVQSSTYCRDARVVRNTALLLGAVILFLDWKWSTGIWDHIGSHLGSRQLLGLGIFLVITIAGKLSSTEALPILSWHWGFDGCVLLSVCSADPLCGSRLSFSTCFWIC